MQPLERGGRAARSTTDAGRTRIALGDRDALDARVGHESGAGGQGTRQVDAIDALFRAVSAALPAEPGAHAAARVDASCGRPPAQPPRAIEQDAVGRRVCVRRNGCRVNLLLDTSERRRHVGRPEPRDPESPGPLVEHEVGRAERDHPVDERPATHHLALQQHDRQVIRRAHSALRIESRGHVPFALVQLVVGDEVSFLEHEHVAPGLGEARGSDRPARAASDDDDIGGQTASGSRDVRDERRPGRRRRRARRPGGPDWYPRDRIVDVRHECAPQRPLPREAGFAGVQRSKVAEVGERLGL